MITEWFPTTETISAGVLGDRNQPKLNDLFCIHRNNGDFRWQDADIFTTVLSKFIA
jgi:hypothetical protein